LVGRLIAVNPRIYGAVGGSGFIGLGTFDQALLLWLHSTQDPSSLGSISLGSACSW